MKTFLFRSATILMVLVIASLSVCVAQKIKKQTAQTISAAELKAVESTDELAQQHVGFLASDDLVMLDPTFKGAAKFNENDMLNFKNVVAYPMPENGIELNATLKESIAYPQYAIEEGIEGVVKVLCTVEKDGSVSSVLILNDIGGKCAEEVCRVIRSVKFKPAMQNGYARRCNLIIPVVFELI
jgi:TonB family protein